MIADGPLTVGVVTPGAFLDTLPGLAALLVDAVESGASVSFLRGLDHARAAAWWTERAAEAADGRFELVVARDGDTIVGCAGLVPARSENSRHRAEVVKVLVLRAYRRRGVASAVLAELEQVALSLGRWLLVLDTAVDVGAEGLYLALGWQLVGEIPDYAVGWDGDLVATRFLYKRLAEP